MAAASRSKAGSRLPPPCKNQLCQKYGQDLSLLELHGADDFEPWIATISEEVLRDDLEKVKSFLKQRPVEGTVFFERIDQRMQDLRAKLVHWLTALVSLKNTGIPSATEVLHLLLRELWARITGGGSKLCDQEISRLEHLCALIQKASEEWDQVKNRKNPDQPINWCRHFCSPICALKATCGEGPPGPVEYDLSLEDLKDLKVQAQSILARRGVTAATPQGRRSAEVAQEVPAQSMTEENELLRMREELQELKDGSLSVKREVMELQQDQLELQKLKSENENLKCQVGSYWVISSIVMEY